MYAVVVSSDASRRTKTAVEEFKFDQLKIGRASSSESVCPVIRGWKRAIQSRPCLVGS